MPAAAIAATVLVAVASAGCSSSSPAPKDAAREGSPPAREPDVVMRASDAGVDASRPAPGACASDADCRTWSSYCAEAPCVCRVTAEHDPEPGCMTPGRVACFVDPCMKKTAACQGGRCVLVTGETQ